MGFVMNLINLTIFFVFVICVKIVSNAPRTTSAKFQYVPSVQTQYKSIEFIDGIIPGNSADLVVFPAEIY